MSRPNKSEELKKLHGTNRADRKQTIEVIDANATVPDKPTFVTGRAAKIWKQAGPGLARAGLLTDLDVFIFAAYCQSMADYQNAVTRLKKTGLLMKLPNGKLIPHPLVKIRDENHKQFLAAATDLGIPKLKLENLAKNPTTDNPFTELRDRKQK